MRMQVRDSVPPGMAGAWHIDAHARGIDRVRDGLVAENMVVFDTATFQALGGA